MAKYDITYSCGQARRQADRDADNAAAAAISITLTVAEWRATRTAIYRAWNDLNRRARRSQGVSVYDEDAGVFVREGAAEAGRFPRDVVLLVAAGTCNRYLTSRPFNSSYRLVDEAEFTGPATDLWPILAQLANYVCATLMYPDEAEARADLLADAGNGNYSVTDAHIAAAMQAQEEELADRRRHLRAALKKIERAVDDAEAR